ncbi:MAG: hypothetical protein Q8N47_13285 [Bryobacterales bacterium]|nr:hypothetical protein [Bryobacterales bacterium]
MMPVARLWVTRNGTVLVISGTDTASTQAGGQSIGGELDIVAHRIKKL